MVQLMVTPINHVIAGPDLHRAGPLALLPRIGEDQKEVLRFECGAPIWYYTILW